jgi:hypothetical protein
VRCPRSPDCAGIKHSGHVGANSSARALWQNLVVLLRGTSGDSLSLNISGYQFPDAEDPKLRYSWHMLEGGASSASTTWSFRYPALTCDESVRLASWLREVSEAPELPAAIEFTEPNLRFEIIGRAGDEVILEVRLSQEFGVPVDKEPWERDQAVLRLQLTNQALISAAQQWMADVERFPGSLGHYN